MKNKKDINNENKILLYKFNKKVKNDSNNQYSLKREILRYNYIQGLIKIFYQEFNKINFDTKINKNRILKNNKLSEIVQRWCWFQQRNKKCKDDIIPYIPDIKYDNEMLLEDINFILEINITEVHIYDMIKYIHRYLKDSYTEYLKILKNDYSIILNKEKYNNEIMMTLYYEQNDIFKKLNFIQKDIIINVNIDVYNRLYDKFIFFSKNINNPDEYIFGLLLRYTYLDSKNQQLAIPKNVKMLFVDIGVEFELFGSAINVINKYYCSLYYDIEQYFGSQGNFFDIKLKQGIYWCNPPYVNIIMKNAAIKIIDFLKKCKNIAFIITIPIWDKYTQDNIINDKITKITKNYNFNHKQNKFIDYDIYYLLHPHIKSEFIIPKNIMPFTNYRLNKIIYPTNTYMLLLYSDNMETIYKNNLNSCFDKIETFYDKID